MGALGSLLGGLGGPKEPWPGRLVDPGANGLNPPRGKVNFDPAPLCALPIRKRGRDHREEGKVPQGELRTTIGKREECRMEERDPPHAQRPRGPAD